MIKLSGYKIIKKIGSGGMGDVYLAEHEKLEKKVAIKSLHKNLATDSSFRERFSQEAKTHSKLDHPNIVKLLDYKERKDGLFLIMEYVDGKQLDEHIKKVTGPIPEKELTNLFAQILDAIGYAHKKGLVHRDIKPANVIISNGKIKVLDFGIAKELSIESGLTKTGVQVGTPMYMSPEQVNAEKIDKLTDIYSLGVTLFYMAVGKPPYENSNAIKMGVQILTEPFPTAKEFYPGISNKIEVIIKKATQKKKADRYQSCEEFKKDLDSPVEITSEIEDSKPKNTEGKKKIVLSFILLLLFALGFVYFFINSAETATEESIEEVVVEEATEEITEDVLCSKSTFKIGDYLGGGIIFYIENNGNYALVCDIKDLGTTEFGCEGNNVIGVNRTAIGTGQQNTKALCEAKIEPYYDKYGKYDSKNKVWIAKTISPYENRAKAAILCSNSSAQGYNDWFLPSKDELNQMYLNKDIIESRYTNAFEPFAKNYYWTSSQSGKLGVWMQSFLNTTTNRLVDGGGVQGVRAKFHDFCVRAVRILSNDCKKACCLGCRALEDDSVCLVDHSCCELNELDKLEEPPPILTTLEIYRKRFNKEPDYGEYIDVSSSYFTGEILYSRITEVLNAPSHKRYGKLNEGLAYADRDIETETRPAGIMVVLGHRSEIKYLLGDYIGALNDINKAIEIAKTKEDADYWIAVYVEERELINNMLENK